MEFESHVDFEPVLIRVLAWEPKREGYYCGRPEDCYEAEGGYGEWEVADLDTGETLRMEIPEVDRERIDREVYRRMESREEDYDPPPDDWSY